LDEIAKQMAADFYATLNNSKVRGDQFRGNLRDTVAKRQQTTRRHKKHQEQLQATETSQATEMEL
jgi:hypothetical protein